jgi:hypothetical protein
MGYSCVVLSTGTSPEVIIMIINTRLPCLFKKILEYLCLLIAVPNKVSSQS